MDQDYSFNHYRLHQLTKGIEIPPGKKAADISTTEPLHIKDLPSHSQHVTKWEQTWFYIIKVEGVYMVDEHGSLQFGCRLSQSLNMFYDAIS